MFYQLQSCTNLENLISKKEKVTSMAKNLSVTTSTSDLKNYLSDLHGSCGLFRTKLDFSFFLPRRHLLIYLVSPDQICPVWTTSCSTTTLTVLTLRRRVSPVAMRKRGKRRLSQGRRGPDVEWRDIEM